MSRLLLYIGNNTSSIEHFRQIVSDELHVVNNYTKVGHIVGDRCEGDCSDVAVVFYEQTTVNKDCVGISYLRVKYPCLFILLVYNNFDPNHSLQYLKAGINDTISVEVNKFTFDAAMDFLKQNQSKILNNVSEKQLVVSFVMPLWKRIFDILFALAALIVLFPILLLVAIAIRVESRGKVLYRSKRVGSNYKVFDFWKFRSMYTDADKHLKNLKSYNQYGTSDEVVADSTPLMYDTGNFMLEEQMIDDDVVLISDDCVIPEEQYSKSKAVQTSNAFIKLENDPRITGVGRFIRKYSIDELPQLINILVGEMSVVGNRPLPLYEAEMLTSDEYIDRFMAPSGLTGLWQVEKRGNAGRMSAEERKMLDIKYANTFSFWGDIIIIFRTFTSFIQKENV